MAMKLHNLGLPDSDNKYLYYLSHTRTSNGHYMIPHVHASVRIADGSLPIRLEYRILLRKGEGLERVRLLRPEVCPHWSCGVDEQRLTDIHLSDIIYWQMRLRSERYCAESGGLRYCNSCSTEFVVACLDSSWAPGGKALYITAWKDCGACETPFDPKWRGHAAADKVHLDVPEELEELEELFPYWLGSIGMAFENSEGADAGKDGLANLFPVEYDAEFKKFVAEVVI